MGDRICKFDGCEREGWYRGKCWRHAARSARLPIGSSIAERIDAYSSPGANGCLVWSRYLDSAGYGRLNVDGKSMRAHRAAWVVVNGEIPDGLQIDHICHNTSCVNVNHLRLAVHAENQRNRNGAQRRTRSGVRNVRITAHGYRVVVTKNKTKLTFGVYGTIAEAKRVAARARHELFGEFAGRG